MAVAALLAAISRSDARERRVPNKLVLALAAVWTALQAGLFAAGVPAEGLLEAAVDLGIPEQVAVRLQPAPALEGFACAVAAVAVLLAVSAVYERFRGKPAMGMGDVKLIGALALFAGPFRLLACVIAACIAALAVSAIGRQREFPFAPSLSLGFLVAMVACP